MSGELSPTGLVFGDRHIKGLAQAIGQVSDERITEHVSGIDGQCGDLLVSLGVEVPSQLCAGIKPVLFYGTKIDNRARVQPWHILCTCMNVRFAHLSARR